MPESASRGAVLEAITAALRETLPRVEGAMPATVTVVSCTADTVTVRAFTGSAEYRVTIEHVWGG